MHIKVYFNDKPLFLCDALTPEISEYLHHEDAIFIDELSAQTVKAMLHEMSAPQIHAGIFLHTNFEELKNAFLKKFKVITAAGGLVINENDEVLLIYRRGVWDLPKGKQDDLESIEECAVREVKEETGVTELVLKRFLLTTYHTYREDGDSILKETHWFKMKAPGNTELIPQAEEQITMIQWSPLERAKELTRAGFPSIKDVIDEFLK